MRRLRIAVLSVLLAAPGVAALAQAPDPVVHDGHFHLTNYIQEGTDIRDFLKIMGTKVGRVASSGSRCSRRGPTGTAATSRRRTTCSRTPRSTTTPSPTPTSRWRTAR